MKTVKMLFAMLLSACCLTCLYGFIKSYDNILQLSQVFGQKAAGTSLDEAQLSLLCSLYYPLSKQTMNWVFAISIISKLMPALLYAYMIYQDKDMRMLWRRCLQSGAQNNQQAFQIHVDKGLVEFIGDIAKLLIPHGLKRNATRISASICLAFAVVGCAYFCSALQQNLRWLTLRLNMGAPGVEMNFAPYDLQYMLECCHAVIWISAVSSFIILALAFYKILANSIKAEKKPASEPAALT